MRVSGGPKQGWANQPCCQICSLLCLGPGCVPRVFSALAALPACPGLAEAPSGELVLAFQTLRAAGLPPCQSHHKPLAAVSATISHHQLGTLGEGLRVLGAPAEQQEQVWTPLP